MWYKINWIYVWNQKVRPSGWWETVQTFDFQNDWDLGWTNNNIGWWDCIVTNEWWQITRVWSDAMQAGVLPPSSVYWGTLTKYKIWAYKSWNAAFWIANSSQNTIIEYGRDGNKLSVIGTTIASINLNWELTMEVTFWVNDITIDINWNTYTSTWTASAFQTSWSNQNLGLELWKWNRSAWLYVRKVEITTE